MSAWTLKELLVSNTKVQDLSNQDLYDTYLGVPVQNTMYPYIVAEIGYRITRGRNDEQVYNNG